MMNPNQISEEGALSRRSMLRRCGTGLATFGLAGLLADDALLTPAFADNNRAKAPLTPLSVRPSHFPAKAKRVIHLFMNGGPSHMDTFDYKPELQRWAGKELPFKLKTERRTGVAMGSPFKFRQYGENGTHVSELFQHTAKHIDDIAIINSMQADVPNHEPSLLLMNCGMSTVVRPSAGSWITYGLGSENQNLPGFIALCPGGYPIKETQNWQSAFLPGAYQGTYVDTQHQEIEKLIENVSNLNISRKQQRQQLDLLEQLNQQHLQQRGTAPELTARIQSYELAYRMQMEATDAFDVSAEPQHVRDAYGEGVNARQILIARRLVERGVRYVQVWHGEGQPWDNHDDLETGHRKLAGECDQAIGALLSDLKERGLLDETLVIWGGEFGRTPVVELPTPGQNQGKVNGRDHNHHGFTVWMAGGGVKGGQVYGATDEFGFKAVEDPVHVHDLHATMLHLLGLDHKRLTYRFAGRDFRLTDVHGNVVHDLIG
jgi:hypothetical protein